MRIPVRSEEAKEVYLLLSGLQVYCVSKLNAMALQFGKGKSCTSVGWECDKGKHGGGKRYESKDSFLFNRVSVNVSHVHYEEVKNKALDFSLVLNVTIHPANPHVPSLHFYVNWEKMKEDEKGSWNLMTDLIPSILNESTLDKNIFSATLKQVTGDLYEEGARSGDKYFNIQVLGRQRGVSHFCLESYHSGNFEEDKTLILKVGEALINSYKEILSAKSKEYPMYTPEKQEEQLASHTLYLFHVLMFEGSTLKALLMHDQDDMGTLASLPSHINRDILSSWVEKLSAPQAFLLKDILKTLPEAVPTPVDKKSKSAIAHAIRKHYKKYPIV